MSTPKKGSAKPTPKAAVKAAKPAAGAARPRAIVQRPPRSKVAVTPGFQTFASAAHHDNIMIRDRNGNPTGKAAPKGVGLSPCALNYAKALCNPFGQFDENPCVPGAPPLPTYRFRALTRGNFTTGTNATGFVSYAPQNPSNNQVTLADTTSAYAGTQFAAGGGVAGSIGRTRSTLPFAGVDLTGGISARLVGSGIRVRNISQALYVGGLLYAIQVDVNEDLNAMTIGQLASDPRTALVTQAMADQNAWSVLVWRPVDMGDLDFMGEDTAYAALTSKMGFLAVAPSAAAPQTYEYEIVEFWEFYGRSTTGVSVPELNTSHSDPVGLSRVLDGIQMRPITLDQKDWVKHTADSIVDAIAHSDSVAKTVEDLLGMAGLSGGVVGGLVKGLTSFLAL